jgi:hydroxymethylpyrimidine pyrophosphatase-like HAD family hydrolase
LLEEPSYLKTEKHLKATMPHLRYVCPSLFFLEVAQNGIDKASVKFLADKLNIYNQVIAVGNAGNDLSMIEYA